MADVECMTRPVSLTAESHTKGAVGCQASKPMKHTSAPGEGLDESEPKHRCACDRKHSSPDVFSGPWYLSTGVIVVPNMTRRSNSAPRAQIPYLLKQAVHVMQRGTDAALKDVGLNTAKYVVLRLLRERPDLSSAQLARRSFLSPQSMQAMIVNLENLGLVKRAQHPENARIWLTRLTKEGERVESAGRVIIDRWSAAIVQHIPPGEQEQFVELLRKAIEGMGNVELIDGVPHRNGMVARIGV